MFWLDALRAGICRSLLFNDRFDPWLGSRVGDLGLPYLSVSLSPALEIGDELPSDEDSSSSIIIAEWAIIVNGSSCAPATCMPASISCRAIGRAANTTASSGLIHPRTTEPAAGGIGRGVGTAGSSQYRPNEACRRYPLLVGWRSYSFGRN